jgi:predicted nucleic acid-binding protein
MSFLLDTNVISEWVRPQPDPGVIRCLSELDEDSVFMSVITLVELRYGIERMPQGARKQRLHEWLSYDLPSRFADRLLFVDAAIADHWGKAMAQAESNGHSGKVMDVCIAAIANFHGLTLVTRNVSDFAPLGVKIMNPWTAS